MNRNYKTLHHQAQQLSNAGEYACQTVHLFAQAWRQSQHFQQWLDYVIFKRQLGYPLSLAHQRIARQWLQKNTFKKFSLGLYGHRLRQLTNLLDEVSANHQQPAVVKAYRHQVSTWRSQQHKWWQEFTDSLATRSVAVVGNSPTLAGQKQGTAIDQRDIVVRFNQFASDQTSSTDIGHKLSCWVMAPGFKGSVPNHVEWVIVTGPQMVWWQQNWPQLSGFKGKVLGIPLAHWRQSVARLQAPPSAGFLVVQTLRQLLPSHQLAVTGFGVQQHGPYHHAIKGHEATSRHNWSLENSIMAEWKEQYHL